MLRLLVSPLCFWSALANDGVEPRLAVALVASVWFEAPRIGNHWLVAGMVAAAALIAGPWRPDDQWWTRFAPTARVLLLVFDSFAAFAKLNAGFFDRSASCVRYFTNEVTGMGGIPEVPAGSVLVLVLAIVTVAVELSIPILLLVPATRRIGVATGVVFHSLIALDLVHHFFDFTAVLMALFGLFLAPGEVARLADRLPTPGPRLRGLAWKLVLLGAFAPGLTNVKAVGGLVILMAYIVWLPLGVSIVRSVLFTPSRRATLNSVHGVSARSCSSRWRFSTDSAPTSN